MVSFNIIKIIMCPRDGFLPLLSCYQIVIPIKIFIKGLFPECSMMERFFREGDINKKIFL